MVTMEQLKPCPFCGGEAKVFIKSSVSAGPRRWWNFGISCALCGIVSPRTDYHLEVNFGSDGELEILHDDRSLAATMWNERSKT